MGKTSRPADSLPRGRLLEAAGKAMAARSHAEAQRFYLQILQVRPDDPEALFGMGNVALERGHFDAAVGHYARAIQLHPRNPRFHGNLGVALHRLGRLDEAIVACGRACDVDPGYTRAHVTRAHALRQAGRAAEALESAVRALHIEPSNPDAMGAKALSLAALGRQQDAEAAFQAGLELLQRQSPRGTATGRAAAVLHHNLGNLLFAQGRLDEAKASFEHAVDCEPRLLEARCNLGILLRESGDLEAAARCFAAALEANPRSVEANAQLGIALLAQGELARGWAQYEWRLEAGVRSRSYRVRPEWRGEALAGKALYVFREQGVGDEIVFASMYGELSGKAARCVIECRPKLEKLLARSFPGAEFAAITEQPDARAADCDLQVSAGSLGGLLRTDLQSFPHTDGYLRADAGRIQHWRQRLRPIGGRCTIGVSWRSSIRDAQRSPAYSEISDWEEVFAVPGVAFVCLQYDECSAELAQVAERFGITIHRFEDIDLFDDLDDVASLMSALDLVISAPTAVALQAAALGRPTWELRYGCDWRRHGTDRNLWLPSLRSFSRKWNQPWREVIASVAVALREFAGRRDRESP